MVVPVTTMRYLRRSCAAEPSSYGAKPGNKLGLVQGVTSWCVFAVVWCYCFCLVVCRRLSTFLVYFHWRLILAWAGKDRGKPCGRFSYFILFILLFAALFSALCWFLVCAGLLTRYSIGPLGPGTD